MTEGIGNAIIWLVFGIILFHIIARRDIWKL